MKKSLCILLTLALLLSCSTVVLAKPHQSTAPLTTTTTTTTSTTENLPYQISFTLPDEITTKSVTSTVYFSTVTEQVYAIEDVDFQIETTKTVAGNVYYAGTAAASTTTTYSITNSGTWIDNLDIPKTYANTSNWTITFPEYGNYTVKFKVVNAVNTVIAEHSETIIVKDPAAIEDEEDVDKIGNTKGLLNALQNHYKKIGKLNNGAARITELLLARGVTQAELDEAIAAIENGITNKRGTAEDYKALGKLQQKKGEKYNTYVNGKKVNYDVQPTLKNDRTLAPFRKIAEALGAEVSYLDGKITVTKDGLSVTFTVGSAIALVNGEEVTLDVPAQLQDGRTLVPLRFLSKALNAQVDFYTDGSLITITQ